MSSGNVLILVENEPVPSDVRVWWECQVLAGAGFEVTVVCPQGADRDVAPFERTDGVTIHRYPPSATHTGIRGHLSEYSRAAWHIAVIVRRLAKRQRFEIVHACNPPDFVLLTALALKRRGTRFVFDHHDLTPELYQALYGDRLELLHRATCVVERIAFGLADVVISTNESYRRVALERGGKNPEDVFIVRNAPDTGRFRPRSPDPTLRRGARHLLAYVGVIGHQDGVDEGLRALASLRRRRSDWRAVFAGDGPALDDARGLARRLGLEDVVDFLGWLKFDEVITVLASADVCLSPEPATAYNSASTLMKIGEYMAMAKPIVCYDIAESRFTAGAAAAYVRPGAEDEFAEQIGDLLDDPDRRAVMGAAGRVRIEGELSWKHSERALLAAYERTLSRRG